MKMKIKSKNKNKKNKTMKKRRISGGNIIQKKSESSNDDTFLDNIIDDYIKTIKNPEELTKLNIFKHFLYEKEDRFNEIVMKVKNLNTNASRITNALDLMNIICIELNKNYNFVTDDNEMKTISCGIMNTPLMDEIIADYKIQETNFNKMIEFINKTINEKNKSTEIVKLVTPLDIATIISRIYRDKIKNVLSTFFENVSENYLNIFNLTNINKMKVFRNLVNMVIFVFESNKRKFLDSVLNEVILPNISKEHHTVFHLKDIKRSHILKYLLQTYYINGLSEIIYVDYFKKIKSDDDVELFLKNSIDFANILWQRLKERYYLNNENDDDNEEVEKIISDFKNKMFQQQKQKQEEELEKERELKETQLLEAEERRQQRQQKEKLELEEKRLLELKKQQEQKRELEETQLFEEAEETRQRQQQQEQDEPNKQKELTPEEKVKRKRRDFNTKKKQKRNENKNNAIEKKKTNKIVQMLQKVIKETRQLLKKHGRLYNVTKKIRGKIKNKLRNKMAMKLQNESPIQKLNSNDSFYYDTKSIPEWYKNQPDWYSNEMRNHSMNDE